MQLQLVKHISGILLPATPQCTELINTRLHGAAE